MRISDWSSDVCSSDLGLYAMEGSLRRIPDSAHVREELAWATARIARALPKAKLMVGAQSVQGIAGLIEDSRVSLERELRFLLKVEIGRASCRERVCQYG